MWKSWLNSGSSKICKVTTKGNLKPKNPQSVDCSMPSMLYMKTRDIVITVYFQISFSC